MMLLAIGLLLVLVLCGWGIVALFRATSSSDKEVTSQETPSAEVQEKPDTAKAQTNAAPATDEKTEVQETPGAATVPTRPTIPLKLPGFYID
jgi:type II secretory pathway component PulM